MKKRFQSLHERGRSQSCVSASPRRDTGPGPRHCKGSKKMGNIPRAAAAGALGEGQQLLVQGDQGLNHGDEWNRTPLHLACANGYPDVVSLLVERKCQLNLGDIENQTPLIKAVQGQQEECTSILLKHDADPHIADAFNNTALHYAASGHNTAIVTELLQHKSDIEAKNRDGYTPLLLAIAEHNEGMVEFFLKKGENVNAMDRNQRTALMIAVSEDLPGIVSLLFKYDVDLSSKDKYGWTAEKHAAANSIMAYHHLVEQCALREKCIQSKMTSESTLGASAMNKEVVEEIPLEEFVIRFSDSGPDDHWSSTDEELEFDAKGKSFEKRKGNALIKKGPRELTSSDASSSVSTGPHCHHSFELGATGQAFGLEDGENNQSHRDAMVAERCENKNYLLDEICGLKEEEVATIKVELEGDKFKDKQKENVQNQGKVLESDFMLEFNDLINQLNESSENQLKLQKSHQKLFNELISFTEELMCKDGHETGKREIKDLPLKVVVSKCKQLESKGQNHQELLIAIKNAQEKYDKLKKRRRELKEEVINLKQQIEMYKVKPGHLEEFKRELKEQTRQKILENLKPINLLLQWQATYQENLDQLRENHSAFMTNQEFQIRDLKLELSKLKNSLQEPQAATERFREFHISDKLNSHRTIEGLASENAKLHYEIPKNEKMHTSIGFTCPIQEPFHVENLNHEVTYNRSRLLRENLGYSTKKTASSKSQMEGYFLKMQQEFHKNVTKGLNETKAELESSSGTSSPLLSLEESSDFEALASRATREYTEVLKKRFMI